MFRKIDTFSSYRKGLDFLQKILKLPRIIERCEKKSSGSDTMTANKEKVEIELDVIKTPMGLVPSIEGLHQVAERFFQDLQELKAENASLRRLLADQAYTLEMIRTELEEVRETITRIGHVFRENFRKITANISALESTIEGQTVNLEIKIRELEKRLE